MPETKAYESRKRILNELLRTRYFTMPELIARVSQGIEKSVSKKTIQDTIKYMRDEGAPIVNMPGRGYIYDPKNYNHYGVKLSSYHVENIKLAASLLRQIPGLDIHEELENIFNEFNMRSESFVNDVSLQFDIREGYQGAKYMVDILEAIRGKTVIKFDYQPFTRDVPSNITVHPYLLKEFNNRWFLVGLSEELRKENKLQVYHFGLERIKSKVQPAPGVEFYKLLHFDPAKFYTNVYGISLPENRTVQRIVVRFSDPRWRYVETNPLHPSQKKGRDSHTFEFSLIINNEWEALILSYGSDAEVLAPATFRQRITELTLLAAEKYGGASRLPR